MGNRRRTARDFVARASATRGLLSYVPDPTVNGFDQLPAEEQTVRMRVFAALLASTRHLRGPLRWTETRTS